MAIQDRRTLQLSLRLFRFAARHWLLIAATAAMIASYGLLQAYLLLLIRPFVKAFEAYRAAGAPAAGAVNMDDVRYVARVVFILAGPLALTGWLGHYLHGVCVQVVVVDIRNAICRALLPQSVGYFEDRRSGEFISRISNDVSTAQKALSFLFGDLFLEPAKVVGAFAVAFYASWQLTLATLCVAPALVVPLQIFTRKVRRASRKSLERLADVTDALSQMFSGIRVVKAFKMEDAEAREFEGANRRYLRNMKRMEANKAHSRGITDLFVYALLGAALLLAAKLIELRWQGLDFAGLLMFGGAVAFSLNPTKKIVKCINNLQEAMSGAERIFEIIDLQPEIVDAPDAVGLDGVNQGVAFRNVTFAYRDEPVLRDVDLKVEAGRTVALVGKSGSGKSTLVDLLLRFYVPREGRVEIDGLDVQRIRRESLLDRIAIVTQQTFLFNRPIAENIRYGRRDATDEEVHAAARTANIHDFILSLPQGYGTVCGEYGAKLSGGQRQRIAIARAVLKDADILVLDEAMVGLDSESEVLVRQALFQLMKGRTTFVITHDLTTIRHADMIVVLRDGRIVQRGTHEDLLSAGGEYAALYRQQAAVAGAGRP